MRYDWWALPQQIMPKTPEPKLSAAERLVAFTKKEKITLKQGYKLKVADKFKNVCPQSVIDALNLGMIEAEVSVTVVDA